MSSEPLSEIPGVDIDPNGVFKYILIDLTLSNQNGGKSSKTIVRGYERCPYHSDIFDEVLSNLKKKHKGLKGKCTGGGRINHDSNKKKILVYGYSQGYGKANHKIAVKLLKTQYNDYDISWNDEGY